MNLVYLRQGIKMEGAQFFIMASFIYNSLTVNQFLSSVAQSPAPYCQDPILGYECGHPELLKISSGLIMKIGSSHLEHKMEGSSTPPISAASFLRADKTKVLRCQVTGSTLCP